MRPFHCPPTRRFWAPPLAAWVSAPLCAQSPPPPVPAPAGPGRSDGTGRSRGHGPPGQPREVARHQEERRRWCMDSINATELGRFPDADVADSLAHLPGITITRTTGGEGVKINVRGLGPRVQHRLAQQPHSRHRRRRPRPGLRRAAVRSHLRRRRAQVAAGLGARGQHRRHRQPAHRQPLRQPRLSCRRARRRQHTIRCRTCTAASILGLRRATPTPTTRWASCSAPCTRTNNLRTDSLNAYNQADYGPTQLSVRSDRTIPPSGASLRPLPAASPSVRSSTRRSATRCPAISNGGPRSAFTLTADVIYTRLRDPQIGYNESYYFRSTRPIRTATRLGRCRRSTTDWSPARTVDEFQPEMVNNTMNRKSNTWLYGLNGTLGASTTS